MFQKGNKDTFFGAFNIAYGFIHVEGVKQLAVIDIANGKRVLTELVSKGHVTADDAQDIETSMRKAGLVEDMQGIFQKIRDYELPESFSRPIVKFDICKKRGAGPIPHGHLTDISGNLIGGMNSINTMASGFNICRSIAIQNPQFHLDAISALKDIVNSDLPSNQDDYDQRYRALPDDVRNQFEKELGELTEEILGFFDDMVAAVGWPRR